MTNLLEAFNIEIIELNKKRAVIEVDITEEMHQPFGIVHGGMNAVLIETAASLGGNENVEEGYAAGVEINVNHIRPVSSGKLTTTAVPVHIGRTTQVWTAEIINDEGKITAVGRMTLTNMK